MRKENQPVQINKIKQRRKMSAGFRRVKALALFALLLVVLGATALHVGRTMDEIAATDAQLAATLAQIETEEARRELIEDSAAYTQSISFIEDVARRRLGLVRRDEIIFIMNSD